MSDKKVLIAYGTRTGCTEGIAQKLAETLEQKGLSTDLLNLGVVKSKKWPSLNDYKGIIVGSSIRATMWTKGVKSFLNKNKEDLKKKETKFLAEIRQSFVTGTASEVYGTYGKFRPEVYFQVPLSAEVRCIIRYDFSETRF